MNRLILNPIIRVNNSMNDHYRANQWGSENGSQSFTSVEVIGEKAENQNNELKNNHENKDSKKSNLGSSPCLGNGRACLKRPSRHRRHHLW